MADEPLSIREIHEIAVITTGTADVIRLQTASEATRKSLLATQAVGARGVGISRQQQQIIQNVGFQLQDFAVQVAAGQGALRAFGQQAPQLFSAFGTIGIGVGVVVAAFSALLPMLKAFQSANLEDALKEFAAASEKAAASSKAASTSVQELSLEYGILAGIVNEANQVIADFDAREQAKAYAELATQVDKIAKTFGILALEQFADPVNLKTLEETIALNDVLVSSMEDLAAATDLISKEQAWNEFLDNLRQAGVNVELIVSRLGDSELEIANIFKGLADGAAETERMAALFKDVVDGVKEAGEAIDKMNASVDELGNNTALLQLERDLLKVGASAVDVKNALIELKAAQAFSDQLNSDDLMVRAAAVIAVQEMIAELQTQLALEQEIAAINAENAQLIRDVEAALDAATSAAEASARAIRGMNDAVSSMSDNTALLQLERDLLRTGAAANEVKYALGALRIEQQYADQLASDDIGVATMATIAVMKQNEELQKQILLDEEISQIRKDRAEAEAAANRTGGGGGGSSAKRVTEESKEAQKQMELLKAAIQSTFTEAEIAAQKVAELEQALAAVGGSLSAEDQARIREAINDLKDTTTEWVEIIKGPLEDSFNTLYDDLRDGAKSVEEAFADMVDNVLASIAKMLVSDQITKLIQILSQSVGSSPGFWASPGPTSSVSTRGLGSPAPSVYTPATRTAYSTTSSSGTRSMSGGGTTVNVNNYTNSEISVQETSTKDGTTIDILVERKLKQAMASGAMDRSMNTNFGVRRRPTS